MPAKKTNVDDSPDDSVFPEIEEMEDVPPKDQTLLAVVEELRGDDVTVSLRKKSESGTYDWLTRFNIDDFSQDHVARKFGGGEYQAGFHSPNGKYLKRIKFKIHDSVKPDEEDEGSFVPVSTNSRGSSDLVIALIHASQQAQQRQSEMMVQMMTAMRESSEASKRDLLQLLTRPAQQDNTAMMVPLLEAVSKSNVPAPQNDGITNMMGVLQLMHALRQYQQGENPDDSEESVWSKLGSVGSEILKGYMGQQVPALPATAKTSTGNDMLGIFEKSMLAQSAARQDDPVKVAETIARNVGSDRFNELVDALKAQDWPVKLLGADAAKFATHHEWLEKLRSTIIAKAGATDAESEMTVGTPSEPVESRLTDPPV